MNHNTTNLLSLSSFNDHTQEIISVIVKKSKDSIDDLEMKEL